MYIYTYTYIYIYTCIHINTYTYIYVYIYLLIYIYVHAYTCIYTYRCFSRDRGCTCIYLHIHIPLLLARSRSRVLISRSWCGGLARIVPALLAVAIWRPADPRHILVDRRICANALRDSRGRCRRPRGHREVARVVVAVRRLLGDEMYAQPAQQAAELILWRYLRFARLALVCAHSYYKWYEPFFCQITTPWKNIWFYVCIVYWIEVN